MAGEFDAVLAGVAVRTGKHGEQAVVDDPARSIPHPAVACGPWGLAGDPAVGGPVRHCECLRPGNPHQRNRADAGRLAPKGFPKNNKFGGASGRTPANGKSAENP